MLSAVPFHSTTEDATKPVPVTDTVRAPLPAIVEDGERDVRVGAGTCGGGGAAMVNAMTFDVPPPGVGLLTVIFAVAAVERSLAGIVAPRLVADAYVVVNAVPFH